MYESELKSRTRQFAVRIIKLVDSLPNTLAAKEIGKQLVRSGMSVGANYRAACRAKSKDDFKYKLGIVVEEADETLYWMELIIEAKLINEDKLTPLMKEANELVSIFTASIKTLKSKIQNNHKS